MNNHCPQCGRNEGRLVVSTDGLMILGCTLPDCADVAEPPEGSLFDEIPESVNPFSCVDTSEVDDQNSYLEWHRNHG